MKGQSRYLTFSQRGQMEILLGKAFWSIKYTVCILLDLELYCSAAIPHPQKCPTSLKYWAVFWDILEWLVECFFVVFVLGAGCSILWDRQAYNGCSAQLSSRVSRSSCISVPLGELGDLHSHPPMLHSCLSENGIQGGLQAGPKGDLSCSVPVAVPSSLNKDNTHKNIFHSNFFSG